MPKKVTIRSIAERYLKKYPGESQSDIARRMFVDFECVPSHAAARSAVRRACGTHSKRASGKAPEPKATEEVTATPNPRGKGYVHEGDVIEADVYPGKKGTVVEVSTEPLTAEKVIKDSGIDMEGLRVVRYVPNQWQGNAKMLDKETGEFYITVTTLYQMKVWIEPKEPEKYGWELALRDLLDDIRESSPVVKLLHPKRVRTPEHRRRELEIDMMDPHFGMQCFRPSSDHSWSIEECKKTMLWALEGLLALSEPYGPFEQIVFPFGNDYLHADNFKHETTGGTPQPEFNAYHHVYRSGLFFAVDLVEIMKSVAKVVIKQIPGNHDRQSSFTLGLALEQRYWNDENVEVDASASPYKFHRYGNNLIGFDHGHSVNAIRLGMVMANEVREDWAETSYREWHLGDQHRKASSKPSSFEEQGVSIEYLAGLTPPNEWHRLKSFNYQKRGATAFIRDYDSGPTAKLQMNLDSYTGRPMGE